jgi:hypothetical protein
MKTPAPLYDSTYSLTYDTKTFVLDTVNANKVLDKVKMLADERSLSLEVVKKSATKISFDVIPAHRKHRLRCFITTFKPEHVTFLSVVNASKSDDYCMFFVSLPAVINYIP